MSTLFFRLLQHDDKAAALAKSVDAVLTGCPSENVYEAGTESFGQVPGSPFAYWVGGRLRRLFKELPRFESEGRAVKQGLVTTDDFRFLRLWSEVTPLERVTGQANTKPNDYRSATQSGKRWVPFVKISGYSPFFGDLQLVVDWQSDGEQLWAIYRERRDQVGGIIKNPDYYFHQGITWASRPFLKGSFSHVPPGAIFSHTGMMLFVPVEKHWATCALLNSTAYLGLLHILMARGADGGQTLKYEIGYVTSVPIPLLNDAATAQLEAYSIEGHSISRETRSSTEMSYAFLLPALLQVNSGTISERVARHRERAAVRERELKSICRRIDELAFQLYGLGPSDQQLLGSLFVSGDGEAVGVTDSNNEPETTIRAEDVSESQAVRDLISYCVGCALGRWDIRSATCRISGSAPNDLSDPLPVCPPGMLRAADGLPATQTPDGYPLHIGWDGVLVDDPDHPEDIVRRVHDSLEAIWEEHAAAIEKEAHEILGVTIFREYFRKPSAGGFWDDHIKRYSKSRRKAPIYWLLQSSKKNYALWLYYHRLDTDLLFKALMNYVEPKIRLETSRLESLQSQKAAASESGKDAKRLAREIERQEDFLSELRDFEGKLRRSANLHLEPDLNDGVVLNIAPLHELVPWKEAKKYWDELLEGKYGWSSIGKQLRERGLISC